MLEKNENCKNEIFIFLSEITTHFFCKEKRAEIIAGKRNKQK